MQAGENPTRGGRGHYDRRLSPSERARHARDAIQEALLDLLCAEEPLSIAHVVAAVGIGRNTFYSHFADLDAAVAEVAERCYREIAATAGSEVAKRLPSAPYAAVAEIAGTWMDLSATQARATRVCLRVCSDRIRAFMGEHIDRVHTLGAAAGVFRNTLEPERRRALVAVFIAMSDEVSRAPGRRDTCAGVAVDALLGLCR